MNTLELSSTTLYYKEGTSDKIYQCQVEPAGDRFVVTFAYGRRNSTLNTGTKTNVPVDLDSAQRIFDKLVKEKKGKGYTKGESGTPYQHTDKTPSGRIPQLLNPIDEDQVQALIENDDYCCQEKLDGRRMLLKTEGSEIHGINKKGNLTGLSQPLAEVVQRFKGDVVLDGECVGDHYYVFDLLVLNGEDIRSWTYRQRLTALMNLLFSQQQRIIKWVEAAYTKEQKVQMLQRLRKQNKEGIVFKHLESPYTAGRPNTGGSQFKHKFVASLSAVVAKINAQRSVELRLWGGDGWFGVGNVTIPANHSIPAVGQVVEIRYLYALRQSGCLYQPVYLGVRDDVDTAECLASQRKFKSPDC